MADREGIETSLERTRSASNASSIVERLEI